MATRRERVVLELEDNFTTPMARAAASAALLRKELDGLSGKNVRTTSVATVSRDMDKVGTSARRNGPEIDRFSGRLTLLRDVALVATPAFTALGAVAIPALTGLAAQMGVAALAGGTMIAAFQGMGDTLEAVNKAAIEPSADNLNAARVAMEGLSPQAQDLVGQLQQLRPALIGLRDAAGADLFPGVGSALDDLEGVLPKIEALLTAVGGAAGTLTAELGEGISGPRGREFLNFLTAEAPNAILELGRTVANLAAGMAELWMAFTPLNRDFSSWLLQAARDFDTWASGLSKTDGFREFVDYIRTSGPQVADAMGAVGNALLQIVQAAAPLGGPVLAGLEAVADVIAAIAGSGAGPAIMTTVTALALLSRSVKTIEAIKASSLFAGLSSSLVGVTSAADRAKASATGVATSMTAMQKAAAGAIAGLAGLAAVDALQGGMDDHTIGVEAMTEALLELDDTTSSGLSANLDGLADSIDRLANPGRAEALQDTLSNALGGIGNEEEYDRAKAQITALDDALTRLVQSGQEGQAADFLKKLGLSDSEMQQLLSLMPQYEEALIGVANKARVAGAAASAAGNQAADGFRRARSSAQEFQFQLAKLNRTLEGRSSMRDYEQALDDFTKAARKNGNSLDITTKKGRETQAALDAIASTTLQVAENMQGTNRLSFLRRARADMIDAAMKLGMDRQQAAALADQLGIVDNMKVNPQVQVDTFQAQSNVRALLSTMAQLRDRTVTVTTVFTESGRRFKDFDTGGYTGAGGKYEPRGIVHAGEVVIPQYLVKRDWWMLKARYGHLPGFADGGYVAPQRASAPSVSLNPSVSVGGTSVRVLIGDRELRDIVRTEMSAERTWESRLNDRD